LISWLSFYALGCWKRQVPQSKAEAGKAARPLVLPKLPQKKTSIRKRFYETIGVAGTNAILGHRGNCRINWFVFQINFP